MLRGFSVVPPVRLVEAQACKARRDDCSDDLNEEPVNLVTHYFYQYIYVYIYIYMCIYIYML